MLHLAVLFHLMQVSDGTAVNTKRIADICPGTGSSSPSHLTVYSTLLVFAADDCGSGSSGRELWATDGTTATRVADLRLGSASSNPSHLIVSAADSLLYFVATDSSESASPMSQLWAYDSVSGSSELVTRRANAATWGDFSVQDSSAAALAAAAQGAATVAQIGSRLLFAANAHSKSAAAALRSTVPFGHEMSARELSAALIVSDVDSAVLTLTLTCSKGFVQLTSDSSSSSSAGVNVTATASRPLDSLVLSGSAAALTAAMTHSVYTASDGYTGWDDVAVTVTDSASCASSSTTDCSHYGGAITVTDSLKVYIAALNDAPVVTVPVVVFTVVQGSEVAVTGVTVSDSDVRETVYTAPHGLRIEGPITVSVLAERGRLSLGAINGLTFTSGNGRLDREFTVTAAIDEVNAALATLLYTCGAGCSSGTDTVTVTADDNGYTGKGGALQDTATISIIVV
jgi:ELWxxDGT repeat protein